MSHQIELRPGGQRFAVADDETVLDAALGHGINLPYGCQSGSCASCRARLIEGRLEHRQPPRALNGREQAAGYVLLCQAQPLTDLVLEVEEVLPGEAHHVRNLPTRVVALEKLAHDVMRVELKLPRSQPFQFRAGQYIDIVLAGGRRRSFSIASSPEHADRLELHIRRVPGGLFSRRVFEELRLKTILRIDGPLGNFHLRDSDRPSLLVAGGTGFAPIKSMLETAFAQGRSQPLQLYWGVRSARDLYWRDLPERWQAEHANFTFTPVLSDPQPGDAGRRGWVHEAVLADHPSLEGHDVYMSGPPAMIAAGKSAFPEHGLPLEHLYFDAFDYAFEVHPEPEGATADDNR